MRISKLFLITSMLFSSWQAGAENPFDDSWYVSSMVSYIDDGDDRDVEDGLAGFHIGIGKDLNASDTVEISTVLAFFNADGFNADQDQWGLGIDFVHRFADTGYFVPYALFGGGLMKTQQKNRGRPDRSGPMASFGIGILTKLNLYNLKLRTELRVRSDLSVSADQDFLLSFGLQRSVRPKPAMIIDSDKDGIADRDDRCEDTPRDLEADSHGCARVRDRDRDGVPDDKDMCAGSPPGSEVDDFGCQRSKP